MIHEFTRKQLSELHIVGNKPLVICDVDEVVVHFTRAFEAFLAHREMWLDTTSFALNGNVHCRKRKAPVQNEELADLIDLFFDQETEHLHPMDGAVESLNDLGSLATVIMLTNLPHHARDKRIANMRKLGLPFPVVTNSGPKGPAIRQLAKVAGGTTVFIDDSPNFITSCHEFAPDVHIVHFLHDERFSRHLEPFPFVSLTTDSWRHAHPHIIGLLS